MTKRDLTNRARQIYMNILVSNCYYLHVSIKVGKTADYIEVAKPFSPEFPNPLPRNNKIGIFELGI